MTDQNVPELRLTDEGLETPDHLVGKSGKITVEKPDIKMTANVGSPGLPKFSELVVFPTTGKTGYDIPEGHIKISGQIYKLVDDRDLNECPHCGSDKVDATSDHPKCYDCDTPIDTDQQTDDEDAELWVNTDPYCVLCGGELEGGLELDTGVCGDCAGDDDG